MTECSGTPLLLFTLFYGSHLGFIGQNDVIQSKWSQNLIPHGQYTWKSAFIHDFRQFGSKVNFSIWRIETDTVTSKHREMRVEAKWRRYQNNATPWQNGRPNNAWFARKSLSIATGALQNPRSRGSLNYETITQQGVFNYVMMTKTLLFDG